MEPNNRILLTNIQRFSLHDGPGIRTTVFLKGCSLRCPWCANPENLLPKPQTYIKDGVEGTYGKYMTAAELVKECLKDKNFYNGEFVNSDKWQITESDDIEKLPGGVTFSGGEPLLQMDALVSVCERLHKEEVHIAVETSLFIGAEHLDLAIKNIDFFYVDVKILDARRCREIEKGELDIYKANFEKLMLSGAPIVIRIPVIGSYTDTNDNRRLVRGLLKNHSNRILKIELIKEHNLGESKYKSLGLTFDHHGVNDAVMEIYKTELKKMKTKVEICAI